MCAFPVSRIGATRHGEGHHHRVPYVEERPLGAYEGEGGGEAIMRPTSRRSAALLRAGRGKRSCVSGLHGREARRTREEEAPSVMRATSTGVGDPVPKRVCTSAPHRRSALVHSYELKPTKCRELDQRSASIAHGRVATALSHLRCYR